VPATREGPSTAIVVRVVLTAVAVLVVLYAVYLVRNVLLLAFVAGFLAVGLDPAVSWVQKRLGLRRGQAVTIILLLFVLTIVGFLAAVVPPLVRQVALFATNLPDYLDQLAERNERIAEFINSRDLANRLREAASNLPSMISGSFGSVIGVAGSVFATIFNGLTVIVLTIYFSLNLQSIREGTFKLVPRSKRNRVQELADPVLTKIGGYIAGNITISIIAGILAFIFLIIAGVPFPVALALWVAIADLIPMVGATLGAIPAVLVAFFVSLPVGIATLVYFIVYQQFENYVVAPRVMTKAVDLSPAAVLLSALIGGALLGVVGVLMAIPFAAGMKLLVQELVIPEADRT
jgi:predicted PurR-regulated permease PerM